MKEDKQKARTVSVLAESARSAFLKPIPMLAAWPLALSPLSARARWRVDNRNGASIILGSVHDADRFDLLPADS